MKILVLSNIFPPGFLGGYELVALDVVNGLQAAGHVVRVLTSNYFWDEAGELAGHDVKRVLDCPMISYQSERTTPELNFFNFANIRILGRELREFRPDVVATFNLAGLGAPTILKFLKCSQTPLFVFLGDDPYVNIDFSTDYVKRFSKLLPAESGSSSIVATSQNLRKELMGKPYAIHASEFCVPGWVHWSGSLKPDATRNGRRFVFSSRIAGHKGIYIVLEAVSILIANGQADFIVDVYGDGELAACSQLTKTRNLDSHLMFFGPVDRTTMQARFQDYDALLFPTWAREPFGLVVGEAAVAGCIPILTRGIGASEWFFDETECFKIDPDAESLAQAMMRMMEMDSGRRAGMRVACARAARKNLSFQPWMDWIEHECVRLASISRCHSFNVTSAIEASFLCLHELCKR